MKASERSRKLAVLTRGWVVACVLWGMTGGLGRLGAATELKGTPEDLAGYLAGLPPVVTLTGEAEVRVAADRAEVTLKVSTESRSLLEAMRQNQDVRGRVAALLKEGGIGSDRVQAARFSTTQKHGVFSEKAKSHRIDHFLKVLVREEGEFQAVAGVVDRLPEVQFLGVEMLHSDKESLRVRAEEAALEKVETSRRRYEEKLGVKLAPRRFQQSVNEPLPKPARHAYYGLSYEVGEPSLTGGLDKTTQIPGRGVMQRGEEGSSPFGELIYVARVAVDYAVERK